jgi:hypothetical protein
MEKEVKEVKPKKGKIIKEFKERIMPEDVKETIENSPEMTQKQFIINSRCPRA